MFGLAAPACEKAESEMANIRAVRAKGRRSMAKHVIETPRRSILPERPLTNFSRLFTDFETALSFQHPPVHRRFRFFVSDDRPTKHLAAAMISRLNRADI